MSVKSQKVIIDGTNISVELLNQVASDPEVKVELAAAAKEKVASSRSYIEKRLAFNEAVYGVNTGFGAFAKVRISNDDLVRLQKNLVRSHASGVGEPLSQTQTRAIMLLRANTLSRGTSGVRPIVVEKILEFLNRNILPVIPSQGSVGASGDLAPLAHLALALIGEGEVWGEGGPVATGSVLAAKSVSPLVLESKEGLSLINGCQVMTAIGLLGLWRARSLLKIADVSGALSLEALKGSRNAFNSLISEHRPHPGEKETAHNLRTLLDGGSEISESHKDCDRVQDAYSLRCMPAVHGAAKSAVRSAVSTLEIEANSSTDNPLVFAEHDQILSCGNFHGQPVALAMDMVAIALTSLASISERRVEKLINPALSDLPAFLTPEGGLNSGFMMAHVAAASLVSESKILSHPASVDSIPTSADKEDHVSMGTIAARKFIKVLDHLEVVLAIELLAAKQGLELLKPLKSSAKLEAIRSFLDSVEPHFNEDRVMSKPILNMQKEIASGRLMETVTAAAGDLQI